MFRALSLILPSSLTNSWRSSWFFAVVGGRHFRPTELAPDEPCQEVEILNFLRHFLSVLWDLVQMKLYSLSAVCFPPVESGCPVRLNSIRQLSETWLSPSFPAGSPYSGFLTLLASLLELRKFSFYLECVVYGNPLHGESIPGGSWWLGSRVQDDDTWEEVKSGKLKGYSMFAVKLSEKKPQANRAYQMQEAPGGRKMNADEWDITMVALVDKPAVDKATYVIMRRAPDGKPIIAPAQKGTNEPREGDTSAMKKIRRVATYHKDETPATDTKTEEGTSQTEAKAEETPPADKEEQAPETQESNDLAATIKTVFQEHMESFKEQVQAMIDTSLEPLKESFRTLETRQARFSGAGALPGSSRDAESDDDGDKGKKAPSWVNYGSRPRSIQNNHTPAPAESHKK